MLKNKKHGCFKDNTLFGSVNVNAGSVLETLSSVYQCHLYMRYEEQKTLVTRSFVLSCFLSVRIFMSWSHLKDPTGYLSFFLMS
jgi:hypothetical protein